MTAENSGFFWASANSFGTFQRAIIGFRSLTCGLARPGKHFDVPSGEETGPPFLIYTLGLYAVLPTVVLNGLLSLVQARSGIFDFNDINPYTISVGHLVQFALAFPIAWIFSWTLFFGLRATGAASSENKDQIRALGWVLAAAFFSLVFWWFGFGVAGTVLLEYLGFGRRAVEDLILGGGLTLMAILAIRMFVLAPWATSKSGLLSSFLGTLIGIVLWFVAMVPFAIVLQGLILAVMLS